MSGCFAARRGVTLLEVLISMFVLLIGLLGVAALMPAGRFLALQGTKLSNATMLGQSALNDMTAHGYLNPTGWYDITTGTSLWDPNPAFATTPFWINGNHTALPAVAIDPLGVYATTTFGKKFPVGASGPSPSLLRISPSNIAAASANQIFDIVFRSGDDLIFTQNPNADLPPWQQPVPYAYPTPTPTSTTPFVFPSGTLKRAFDGSYSWLATVVPDSTASALNSEMIVSVAVFYKRDLATPATSESVAKVSSFPGSGLGGGEATLTLVPPPAPNPLKPVKPGQWIMLAGTLASGANNFRWYRVVAADVVNGTSQNVTLAGPDWNANTTNTTAFICDGIIAVFEKNVRLELP